jgi:hypothetical protein
MQVVLYIRFGGNMHSTIDYDKARNATSEHLIISSVMYSAPLFSLSL